MSAKNWAEALTPYREAIEAGLRSALQCPNPALAEYYDMMRYHMGWVDAQGHPVQSPPGKRLRPLLCLLACQSAGGQDTWRQALPAAVAIELVHNFSLIHDDIEDGDEARRHRPTVWKVWGMPQAINAGDGMLSLAHQALQQLAPDVPADLTLILGQRFEAACVTLCHGQYLDMQFERRTDVTVADYVYMVQGKTASLFATALEMGALLGTDGPAAARLYRSFGQKLGLAFQIQDDVLGIWGDPVVTGKPAANDLLRRKKSWPVLYALESATGPAQHDLMAFYQQDEAPDDAVVDRILDILNELEARARAEALVR
ncbi:MAG: polyprenyl synthetase family protein, partial [Chloroflexi bacterium]|nr:polyprenyl synthetase family protein [Chloroflexota bacterium]